MKYNVFILVHFLFLVCQAAEKPYESYDQIVNRLSRYRNQQEIQKISTTVPIEKFHVSFGLSNSSTTVGDNQVGGLSQNGFIMGAALPLITQQLFVEAFAKFYQSSQEGNIESDLQQFEVRVSHKESLSFALLNLGVGTSARFLSINGPSINNDYRIPALLLTAGLERRMTSRMSVAGDFGYHRSLRDNNNGKNAYEFVLRLNYHL